jgi:hypothetical protein
VDDGFAVRRIGICSVWMLSPFLADSAEGMRSLFACRSLKSEILYSGELQ